MSKKETLKIDPFTCREIARTHKRAYDAFREEGFSRKQAFDLTKALL